MAKRRLCLKCGRQWSHYSEADTQRGLCQCKDIDSRERSWTVERERLVAMREYRYQRSWIEDNGITRSELLGVINPNVRTYLDD